jgi:hypothetical protein
MSSFLAALERILLASGLIEGRGTLVDITSFGPLL